MCPAAFLGAGLQDCILAVAVAVGSPFPASLTADQGVIIQVQVETEKEIQIQIPRNPTHPTTQPIIPLRLDLRQLRLQVRLVRRRPAPRHLPALAVVIIVALAAVGVSVRLRPQRSSATVYSKSGDVCPHLKTSRKMISLNLVLYPCLRTMCKVRLFELHIICRALYLKSMKCMV